MTFCHLSLSAKKPLPSSYPDELDSLGDHLRKERLDRGDYQKEVARKLDVDPDTVKNWELGHTEPALRHIPHIVRYLGYVPFESGESLSEKLKFYRQLNGYSQRTLADKLDVNETTVRHWEAGRSFPSRTNLSKVREILQDDLPSLD